MSRPRHSLKALCLLPPRTRPSMRLPRPVPRWPRASCSLLPRSSSRTHKYCDSQGPINPTDHRLFEPCTWCGIAKAVWREHCGGDTRPWLRETCPSPQSIFRRSSSSVSTFGNGDRTIGLAHLLLLPQTQIMAVDRNEGWRLRGGTMISGLSSSRREW
jgi:hypothetical protein